MEPFRNDFDSPRGFTLVELLVCTGIIILITAVIFSGQTTFNNSVVLTSTAYDIALTMRDAQTYGLGTRSQLGVANAGYGLEFKSTSLTSYTFFADTNPSPGAGLCHPLPANGAAAPNAYPGDCAYTAGSDALVASYKLGSGMKISDFCAKTTGTWACENSHGFSLSRLDLVFERPNGTAFISPNGTYNAATTDACITITAPSGSSRYISLSSVSQIVANATSSTSCP